MMALANLQNDLKSVCGAAPAIGQQTADKCIIIGSPKSQLIQQLMKSGKVRKGDLEGTTEKYLPVVGDIIQLYQ